MRGIVHPVMHWRETWRADPRAARIADRHYSRKTPGSPQFTPPGRVMVLLRDDALWVSSWPYAEYVLHQWAGAILCSLFRNEGPVLSSTLIRDAMAATRWKWPDLPPQGMVTFIDAAKVRRKRDPGRCFRRAGFTPVGTTKSGLLALRILPADWPPARAPIGAPLALPFV